MADLFFGQQGRKLPSSPKSEEIVPLHDHTVVKPRRKFGRWSTDDAFEAPKAFPASLQEFVLELAADVELLWQHLRKPGLSYGEQRQSGPDAPTSPTSECPSNTWVADELMSLRAELRSSYAELNWSISEVERSVRSGREALEALETQHQELQEGLRHSGSHDHELDFGAPIGKTLNTQDLLALHVQLKSELHECRMDIRRLSAERVANRNLTREAAQDDDAESPPSLAASKSRPVQLADMAEISISTTGSGLTSPVTTDLPSPMEKQDPGPVRSGMVYTL